MGTIASHANPVFKALLKARKDRGMMLLEGRRLVIDALSRGMEPALAAVSPGYAEAHGLPGVPHAVITEQLFGRIAETATPQGILAFFPVPWASWEEVAAQERIIILDGLQDPGNVGTIIRTAEAFGFGALIVTEETASPFSPKAIRASMGSFLGLRIAHARKRDLERLPHRILSLALSGSSRLSRDLFRGRTAICLGQEGAGVSREILEISDEKIAIPMQGEVESLNVAVAAGIVMAYASGALDPL
jgi:RNA methyltransferase, TrmH family